MPNLNLNEDPRRRLRQQPLSPFKKPPITGGGSKMLPLMVLFGLLIFVGVILYLLNQTGYIHLWGEKSVQTMSTSMPEEKIAETPQTVEVPADQKVSNPKKVDENVVPKVDQKSIEPDKGKSEQKQKEEKPGVEVKKEAEKKIVPKATQERKNVKLTGGYAIFIGSYRDRKKAEAEAQRWSEAGFEVAVNEKSFNSGKWYRVHIGNFSDREEAKKIALKLADGFEGGYWIDVVK